MNTFAKAIGLSDQWPVRIEDVNEVKLEGLLVWAGVYLKAAEILHFEAKNIHSSPFYCGPVVHNVGLATELTLKAMLRGSGKTMKETRIYNHNLYTAYFDLRACFNEERFINLHMSNTAHLVTPPEVRARLSEKGEVDIDCRWRVYFDHLRLLDAVYDRPYRSRYVSPGPMSLPETEIVLVGTKILLSAMEERVE